MSTTLTITIRETSGRAKLSRVLYLGSEYDLTFVGLGVGEVPSLILYDCEGTALVTSAGATLELNTLALASLWVDDDTGPKTVHLYAYLDSVILATCVVIIYWSPLNFEYGDPADVQSIKELWDSHILDTDNPHSVTLAQVGAAATGHTHDMSSLIVNAPGGAVYQMLFEFVDGELTDYLEEV